MNPKLFVYDLETTGLGLDSGIHQIAGLICEVQPSQFKVHKTFNLKVRPFKGDRVYEDALAVGNVTLEDIAKYQEPEKAFAELKGIILSQIDKFNKEDKMTLVGFNNLHFDKSVAETDHYLMEKADFIVDIAITAHIAFGRDLEFVAPFLKLAILFK